MTVTKQPNGDITITLSLGIEQEVAYDKLHADINLSETHPNYEGYKLTEDFLSYEYYKVYAESK
jgi:hypothetical protein